MRLLLLMLGISVCVVGIGTRAEAQNYPWSSRTHNISLRQDRIYRRRR
jgi:hypothetical protein